ncbi:hypothetical protein SDC9_123271 [bioreactor metagenome]|uniref:Uncharacterized protein n=1 Tax=bioreactor metagenome TaxID=1076179 RepID=A0A645CH55_9ZZZZ
MTPLELNVSCSIGVSGKQVFIWNKANPFYPIVQSVQGIAILIVQTIKQVFVMHPFFPKSLWSVHISGKNLQSAGQKVLVRYFFPIAIYVVYFAKIMKLAKMDLEKKLQLNV